MLRVAAMFDSIEVKIHGFELEWAKSAEKPNMTYGDFELFTFLHRLTFYVPYLTDSMEYIEIRHLLERIVNDQILKVGEWDEVKRCYVSSKFKEKLVIHWKYKDKIINFIEQYCNAVVNTDDRRRYAMACYHGLLDHILYCNLREECKPLISMIDFEDDRHTLREFYKSAEKFKVLTPRELR
jgi:hypothetical protein